MQPCVVFRGPDGQRHRVPHGGVIGRLSGAALVLRDPRVSEAHAMVSLRGGALHLQRRSVLPHDCCDNVC